MQGTSCYIDAAADIVKGIASFELARRICLVHCRVRLCRFGSDPLCPNALQPSSFHFEMHRGVMRVWTDASRSVEVGPVPGSDYNFFSDMQRRALTLL